MSGRYVTYDHIDLFEGLQQASRNTDATTNKGQQSQQRTSPFPFMNNNRRVNGHAADPCGQDYDPTALLAGVGPYNSTAAALGNAGAQLIAAGAAAAATGRSVANTIPGYGLYRPAGAPNPALIQNNLPVQNSLQSTLQHHQAAFHRHHQQQQQHQQQHRQRQQQQQHAAAIIRAADYELPIRQQAVPNRHQRPQANDGIMRIPPNLFGNDFDVAQVISSTGEIANTISNPPTPPPAWLKELKITVSGLALEPMSGSEVIERIEKKTSDVIKRYLPCVDFLVACQQDLRKGLAIATQKRLIRRAYRDALSPRQFHTKYIAPLADRFLISNQRIMEQNYLTDAYNEVKKLAAQAGAVERQGAEVMKNTFLGGMKDGESWGLRKWLSKHGGALQICTDLELILSACQKLDKELDSTKKIAGMMRPLAKNSLDRLKADVPQSYQEISTAHPYLPFFHRVEAALRSMSNFDPEDDDVICLDDSDDEDDDVVVQVKSAPVVSSNNIKPAARKRSPPNGCNSNEKSLKRPKIEQAPRKVEPVARYAGRASESENDGNDDDSDSDSDIEVVGVKPAIKTGEDEDDDRKDDEDDEDENDVGSSRPANWTCTQCFSSYPQGTAMCNRCKITRDFAEGLMQFGGLEGIMDVKTGLSDSEDNSTGPNAFDFVGALTGTSTGDRLPASRGQSPIPTARKATPTPNGSDNDPIQLAQDIDALADVFEIGRQSSIRPSNAPVQPDSFWEGAEFGKALRIVAKILRTPEAAQYVNPVDTISPPLNPEYTSVIKNPLCFRDIVSALIPNNFNNLDFDSGRSGILSAGGLSFWNMWVGQDLLQACDLVFLNALAYGKISEETRIPKRSVTNKLRKMLWNGIQEIISRRVGSNKDLQKQHAPTRRGETSGFVIWKTRNR